MGPPPAMRETTARLARLPSFEADALKSVKKHTAAQKIVLKVRELLGLQSGVFGGQETSDLSSISERFVGWAKPSMVLPPCCKLVLPL